MKKKLIIIILTITTLFSACQKTPTSSVVNNSTTEMLPIETESPINVDELTSVTMIDEEVNEVLEFGDVTVTLNGTISKPSTTEGLYIYSAEVIDYSEYENNMTFLFGEYEDLMYRDELSKHLIANSGEKGGYYAIIINTSLYDEKKYIGPWGGIQYLKSENPVAEDRIKISMSNEDAIAQTNEIFTRIGLINYEYDRLEYYEEVLQITPEGTYSSPLGDRLKVYYLQKLQGVPIRSELIGGRINPFARVIYDSEGVYEVMISEYNYEPYAPIEECLTYEKALEKFRTHVANDSKFNKVIYDTIRFEYTITKEYVNGEFVTLAIPCWHFYCERSDDDMLGILSSVDIIIDCVNGKIYEETDVQ